MIEIVRLYKAGQSISQIAAKLGVSKTTIHKKLRREITLRPAVHRTHPINISNLVDYKTEVCAYWLGYLAAKGTFQKTRITLRLSNNHIRHLHKWAEALQSPLMPTKHSKRCRLSVNHAELVRFYKQNGVLEYKRGNPIPLPLLHVEHRHLLRGLWDGNGVITRSSRYLRMGFSTKHREILDLIQVLVAEVNVVSNSVDKRDGRFYLWWCGQPALAIARYLYFNQTISLDRNTNKVLNYLLVQK